MTTTIASIRNLIAERATKTKPLIAELGNVLRDDSTHPQYRQRRERELRAEIQAINDDYGARIGKAAGEAAKEPQRRWSAGTPIKSERLAEAQLVVEQYRGTTRQEQRQLVADIQAALAADDASTATVLARAARALKIPLGPVEAQLAQVDPAKRDARDALDVIEGLTELALAEPIRELAAAGFASASERVALKAFAHDRGLRPDAPFTDQVEPGYAGPSVEHAGTPVNPFPEPHDPQRDQQRAKVERMARDTEDPAATAARYEERGGQPYGNDNLRLHD